jgi:hypothetical protein
MQQNVGGRKLSPRQAAADKANDLGVAREAIRGVELRDRSITAAFERTGKGRITYSHHPRTNAETP